MRDLLHHPISILVIMNVMLVFWGFMGLSGTPPCFAAPAPIIQAVLPPSGAALGQIVTIQGSGFLVNTGPNYQTINNKIYLASYANGRKGAVTAIPDGYIFYVSVNAIKFTMPLEVNTTSGGGVGVNPVVNKTTTKLTPGPYKISVGNINGMSNEADFTFRETPSILRTFPNSGTTGTEIRIEGSGFTATGNWIGFPSNKGIEGGAHRYIPDIPSRDGKHLRFVIPAEIQVRYLDYSAGGPPVPRQKTEKPRAGTFNISVGNMYGESNLVPFTFYEK